MSETTVRLTLPVVCWECEKPLTHGQGSESVSMEAQTVWRDGVPHVKIRRVSVVVCPACAPQACTCEPVDCGLYAEPDPSCPIHADGAASGRSG